MMTYVHLLQYLFEFFLDSEISRSEVVQEIEIFYVQLLFSRKSCRLWDNLERYCGVGHATDSVIRRMRVACWITKAADTNPEYVILIVFPRQQWLREHALVLRFYVHPLSLSMLYLL
jgi:hypothetical protein